MTEEKSTAKVELADIVIKPYRHPAAGARAILSTLKQVSKETGIFRGAATLLRLNQVNGFDCPGCAWPEPDPSERSRAEFCENGAKAVAAEATLKRIDADFFRQWPIAKLLEQSDYWLESQGRLTQPMVRRENADFYEPISWEDAFALIAEELNALHDPNEAVFYTSGRTSNEAAFLYQLFVREFGTNNLPDCSNMCHESTGVAMQDTLGVGKGTVTLRDFEHADAIFVIGQNPGTNHPRMLTALEHAARRGCHIVSVNPLRERGLVRFAHPQSPRDLLFGGAPIAEMFLQVRVNGDVALLKGIMKELFDMEDLDPGKVLDWDFIGKHTSGFDDFRAALRACDWDEILKASGVDRAEIRRAAEIYANAERTIVCWAMGLTQHENGVNNIKEVVNLLLLRGNLGKEGAGACPVRGHSNVQGDRTMGIWERPDEGFLDRLRDEFGFEPPRAHGLDVVGALKALHEGRAHVFFALGGNFQSATPDTKFAEEALRRANLTAHVSTKFNRSHLVTGKRALILPCLGRTELDVRDGRERIVSVEDSMSVVHASRGRLRPASERLRSEPDIVAKLARVTLGERSKVDWEALSNDYDAIRDSIARVVPGFEDFNRRLREPGGFLLPNTARSLDFRTTSGKASFRVVASPKHELKPNQLLMMTIRSHDQYNTTIYGLDDRYRGVYQERRVVFLNPSDIDSLGLVERQVVDLSSVFRGERRVARRLIVVPYDIPKGCAATYFPETNVLVPIDAHDPESRTPASKSVIVEIAPTGESEPSTGFVDPVAGGELQ